MDPRDLVMKSDLGHAEVLERGQNLPPKLRRLLIMLDGTRSVAEIEQIFAPLGNVSLMLQDLLERELITIRSLRPSAAAASAPRPARAAAAAAAPIEAPAPAPVAPVAAPAPPVNVPPYAPEPAFAQAREPAGYAPAPVMPVPHEPERVAPAPRPAPRPPVNFESPAPAPAPAAYVPPPAPAPAAIQRAYAPPPMQPAAPGPYAAPRAPVAPTAPAYSRVAAFPSGLPVDPAQIFDEPQIDHDLAPIKAEIRAHLTGVLGSDEVLIDAKLSAVSDRAALRQFLAGCERVLSTYGGVKLARKFRDRFAEHY